MEKSLYFFACFYFCFYILWNMNFINFKPVGSVLSLMKKGHHLIFCLPAELFEMLSNQMIIVRDHIKNNISGEHC